MLLAYWAITLRTAFSTGAGMRPDTLVMISCSSSSGSDGCRRVLSSFCTQSFSCGGTRVSARGLRGAWVQPPSTGWAVLHPLNRPGPMHSSSQRSRPGSLCNSPGWNGPGHGGEQHPPGMAPLPALCIQTASLVQGQDIRLCKAQMFVGRLLCARHF